MAVVIQIVDVNFKPAIAKAAEKACRNRVTPLGHDLER